ncbi:MAG: type II toxin-antitoxin system HicB family antitoxin [Actinomycetia bacterium]|nr:type II toxin-antitoxin system HicB family antitoxin [Actinomycetes bacterium]
MDYIYNVVFTPEGIGGFSVEVPDLPGCFSQGETLRESVENITEAMALYIEDCIASQEDIPDPSPIQVERQGDEAAMTFPVAVTVDPRYVSVGEPYLTTTEAGELLGVNPSRVRQLVLSGRLESRKRGRDLQIARWSVDEYRKSRAVSRSKATSAQLPVLITG